MRIIALWLLLSSAALAQTTTLTYQGTETNMAGSPYAGPACFTYLCMVGQVVLPAPLAPNLVNAPVKITSITLAMDTLANATTAPMSEWSAYFSTDAAGKITGWNVYVIYGDGQTFISTSVGDYDVNGFYSSTSGGKWTQPTPPSTIPPGLKAMSCVSSGTSTYKAIVPTNSTSIDISATAANPGFCKPPGSYPSSYYVRTTLNNGATWQWTYTLKQLGLGK